MKRIGLIFLAGSGVGRTLALGPSNSDVCFDAAESYTYSDLNTTEELK